MAEEQRRNMVDVLPSRQASYEDFVNRIDYAIQLAFQSREGKIFKPGEPANRVFVTATTKEIFELAGVDLERDWGVHFK